VVYKKTKMIEEKISAIGLGCWNFGGDWDSSDKRKSIAIVHAAIEMGINLFDVAPVYGWGQSETILGKALQDGRRNKVLIASKGGLLWDKPYQTQNNLSRKSLLKEIDASLKRLQTDYIDIYQMHWPDPATPLQETAQALEEIRKAGKIRYVGLSNFAQRDVEMMMDYIPVHCQQSLYNMLERNSTSYHGIPLDYRTEAEVLPIVKKYGQAFLPYSPLFQGLLAGKFDRGITFSKKDIRNANPKFAGDEFEKYCRAVIQIEEVGRKIGRPVNEIAFNWLRRKPEVTCIIAGASSVEQLQKNVKSVEWDLDNIAVKEIEVILQQFAQNICMGNNEES
jgi:aryl-alcohol dehydrogenase-like predicted oxidoreductase